jgi:hypothetical protein
MDFVQAGGEVVSISMYQATVPVFDQVLASLASILAKGETHARTKGFEPAVLVNARLAPDMFPLARQVQIATDVVKGCAARLSDREPPSWPDTESSFPELAARVQKARDYLAGFAPDQLDGTQDKRVSLKIRGDTHEFRGLDYLQQFVLPNLYFHVTTAYNILRHNGVELGKRDFLGAG